MSESEIIEETLTLVKDAQKQGTFNLIDAVKGRAYPTKELTVYVDVESAFQLVELENKLAQLSESGDAEAYDALEITANELAKKVQDSKLVFSMRGISQAEIDGVEEATNKRIPAEDGIKPDEWYRDYMNALVASNIIKVTNANGEVDERIYTADDVDALRNFLPKDSWDLLTATMQKLTLATGFFDGLTDAGFLPRS